MSNGKILHRSLFGAGAGLAIRPTVIPTHAHASSLRSYATDNGTHIIENLRIFKVGTFTDMFGVEATWDDIHLEAMIAHFHLLRDGGYLVDVPVRADHSISVKDVVGYYVDIYRDPDDPQFLSASIEITEDDAWEKWERRTWRSRSIEIGMYETNDGKRFYPVVTGLAFVDIGAVEGLHARPRNDFQFHQVVTDTEENSPMQVPDINTEPDKWIAAVNYAAWVQSANFAQACQDWERAVNYAHALQQQADQAAGGGDTGTQTPPAQPPAITGGQPQPHRQPVQTPMAFRVNGGQTTDFMAVQAHIDALEQFRTEQFQSGRSEFVKRLAEQNKIAATQIADLTSHALSLNDEQFAHFKKTYEAAPSLAAFGTFSGSGDGHGGPPLPPDGGNQGGDVELAKEIVAQHRLSGMSEDQVKATASFRKLVAAGIESDK